MCSVGFSCSAFCFLFFRQFSALFLCFLPLAVFGKFTFVTCSRSPARVQLFLPSSGFFSLSKPISATEAGTLTDPVKKILHHSFPIPAFSFLAFTSFFSYNKYIGNCSEPTSKMLRISSVWRIRQIKFQKQESSRYSQSAFATCIFRLFYEILPGSEQLHI